MSALNDIQRRDAAIVDKLLEHRAKLRELHTIGEDNDGRAFFFKLDDAIASLMWVITSREGGATTLKEFMVEVGGHPQLTFDMIDTFHHAGELRPSASFSVGDVTTVITRVKE